MVDPVLGSVKGVVNLALVIKKAADTVRSNKAAVGKLTNIVDILHAIMAPLEGTDMVWTPGMRTALTSLEGALRRGHNLVTACQKERNIIYILFTAGWRSKQLLDVEKDINAQIRIANLAVGVTILVNIAYVRHPQQAQNPQPLQGVGGMDNSNISAEYYSTNYMGIHTVEENEHAPSLIIFPLDELEVATNNFLEENVIGKGGSATVYKGALRDKLVSIKKYHDQLGPQSIKQYINVFQLLIEHKNVVKFLGFCHSDGGEMVVEEYMPKGSLYEIINGSSQKLDWLSTFRVIQGVAHGVAYLHSKHVIHLGLNPANILFDSDMNPKISNFERSKLLDKNVTEEVTYDLAGTMGYMSPEYITDGIIAMPSDVFGFGVLLLHSISGMRSSIHDQHPITWAWEVREAQGMNGHLDSAWYNEHHLAEIKRCMEIGLLCTQEIPKDRPTMPDVVEFLKGEQMLPTPKKPCFV